MDRSLRDTGPGHKSLWIHEGTNLRVIIDFGDTSPESLKQQPHYAEARLLINGLPALVCSYDHATDVAGSLKKVVALFFLEKRKQLGAAREPSYRVEYAGTMSGLLICGFCKRCGSTIHNRRTNVQ
jgi:hypothetical protein